MKVLILSITTGQGHNATAKAIGDYLETLGIESKIMDTYRYLNPILAETVDKGYLFTSSATKTAYSKLYRMMEKRKKSKPIMSWTRLSNKIMAIKLKGFIRRYNPDVIVCTHIFAGILIDVLLELDKIHAKTLGIVTDFTFHPYWEEALHFDYIITPSELMEIQAQRKGFLPKQIKPLGIPINPKFTTSISKEVARETLGLNPNLKTLLIMGGSMGYGNLAETVQELDKIDEDFQMITVCGKNQEVKDKIDNLVTKKTILNYGYTDNVDLLMDAATCIVTKPGGLTSSEALAKNLPIIIVHPIPGQEYRNTDFLLNCGVAAKASSTTPLCEVIFQLFKNPKRLDLMRECISLIRKPNSTKDICEFIKQIGSTQD